MQTLVHFFFLFACFCLFLLVDLLHYMYVVVNLVFKTIYNMSTLNQRLIS